MSTTYTQKQTPTQKKDAPSASSVLDASSQSESLQRKVDLTNNAAQRAEAPRPNNTGMPDNLKSGIESLSGFSMDDVRVHYNSSKPATVQALAYTQGTDIHVAPGQEKHLPHEAWHVAQQMAGRVSPTTNINGMPVNDNAALEYEADVMGEKAVQCKSKTNEYKLNNKTFQKQIFQRLTAFQKKCIPFVFQMKPKINGVDINVNDFLKQIFNSLSLNFNTKQIGTFIGKNLIQDDENYDSYEALVKQYTNSLKAYHSQLRKSVVSKALGSRTENGTAKLLTHLENVEKEGKKIGGILSQKNGKDVEWRAFPRVLLDQCKQDLNKEKELYSPDANGDFEFFCNISKHLNYFKSKNIDISAYTSTPVDVYSSKALALAGGCAKFTIESDKLTSKLTPEYEARVDQLKKICTALGYTPILTFNSTVPRKTIKSVAKKYGITVFRV